MKTLVHSLILATVFSTGVAYAEDEYEYIATPVPNQIDDLLDEDKDGVINARDLCPQTPARSEIDNDGCGTYINTSEKIDLHILFANDSDVVQPIFMTQVRELADFLEEYPSTTVELQGYASKVGRPDYNLELSKRRAEAVENLLLDYQLDADRVTIVGFGDTNLSVEGDDEQAHAQNRKVVASVIGHKGQVKEEWTIFTKIEK
ncbi:OmpA family protein [Vibrio sp. MarTm2]|uniref:Membrane protein n=2 Tax=Vibrio TaxID=662 RepID=A0ABR4YG31_9VIBR|nr:MULTISPECIES: OmpA family protein [Vibrio]KHA62476.1 membrane protein [Vibrio variabilis]KHD24577.1 membrane protein [Vibrio caribbeanicus]KHT40660.1 membrane protein [Vibrio sinaloensis]KHT45174.1 membrane protein [Vibrio sinaloensis]KIE20241.1 membrane protein [Vibrio sinaloensis]